MLHGEGIAFNLRINVGVKKFFGCCTIERSSLLPIAMLKPAFQISVFRKTFGFEIHRPRHMTEQWCPAERATLVGEKVAESRWGSDSCSGMKKCRYPWFPCPLPDEAVLVLLTLI
jgi:hypothetical protein